MLLRALLTLVVLLCFLRPQSAHALDPVKSFHHYVRDSWSVQEGMPQISAVSIAQTPDGYIWIATQAGVARFDGVGFTTFSPSNQPALPHPVATVLEVDGSGAMWIGTRGGLAVMRDGAFHAVPWTGPGPAPMVNDLQVEPGGSVWAATSSGVARVSGASLVPVAGPDAPNAVLRTRDGALWVAGLEGVHARDGAGWTMTGTDGALPLAYDLLEIDGAVWAATVQGLYLYDGRDWRPLPGAAGQDALPLHFLYRDSDGNVWAGGDLGLLRVRPDRSVEVVPATRGNGLFNLFGAYEDREGNLWLGSLSNGLTRIWNGWTRRYSTQEGLPDATVWTLVPDADGDGIWVGTNNGLARLGREGRFSRPARELPAQSSAVRTLFSEPGRLWIGTRRGLALYEPAAARGPLTPEWARGIRTPVTSLARDRDGALWIGTPGPILRWDGTTLEEFGPERGLAGPLSEFRITRDGRRLALAGNRLFEFDGTAFVPAPEAQGLPTGVRLAAFTELEDGRLLLAGVDAVLLLRHQGRWHRLDESTGLLPGAAFQVLEHAGDLWVSGMHGVYRLSRANLDDVVSGRAGRLEPQMLLNERGMPNGGQQGLCCNGSGVADGFLHGATLWLPTRDGVVALDTAHIVRNPILPRMRVSRLQVGERVLLPVPGTPITLDAGERDLVLAFDVLSYQDPRSNRVRYRLAGYDRRWQDAAPMARRVRYTNLPAGRYTFEVVGSNNADAWSPGAARLEFVIRPYFHETPAFGLLLAALALLLVYAGYRYQRHRFRVRQSRLEALVDERTAALAASNRRLEQASLTDPLTGLRNRRYLARQIPADLDFYDRGGAGATDTGEVIVFAMLDVDHFKQVNDLHGHAAGDRVLEEVARRLEGMVRSGDYVVRWGGEEFLLVFRPMPSGQVPQLGNRLRGAVSGMPFDIGNARSVGLTASVGLSEYPLFRDAAGQPLGWEGMVELADLALYQAKRHGRDGWAMFRPTAATRAATLLAELQRGPEALLQAGELALLGSNVAHSPVEAD